MRELIEFFLHLAFGGFLFLCLIYVLQVMFFLSANDSGAVSGKHSSGNERTELVPLQAHSTSDTHTENMGADTAAFQSQCWPILTPPRQNSNRPVDMLSSHIPLADTFTRVTCSPYFRSINAL